MKRTTFSFPFSSTLKTGLVAVVAIMLSLTGCADLYLADEVTALSRAQPVGSAFTRELAMGYDTFASYEYNSQGDKKDGRYFARKGLDAARGNMVMPEPVDHWDLMPVHMSELGTARGRLVNTFELGAREIAPREAAHAQVKFDCWIEQQEENWQAMDILSCKRGFLQAMDALELAIAPPPSTPPVPAPPVENYVPSPQSYAHLYPADTVYIVFFDFDKRTPNATGREVVNAVARHMRHRPDLKAVVVGFADRVGAPSYNQKLAIERADNVRKALINTGISPHFIRTTAQGENNPIVRTNDGVKEPANRRVEVRFE